MDVDRILIKDSKIIYNMIYLYSICLPLNFMHNIIYNNN